MGCLFLCLGEKNGGKKVKRIANASTSHSHRGNDEVIEALSLVKSNNSINDAIKPNCCSKEDVKNVDTNVTTNDALTIPLDGSSLEKEKGKDFQEGGDQIIDGNNEMLMEEESVDSLFSLPIESRKQGQEVEKGEQEVTSPMTAKVFPPDEKSRRSESVLFPIENLSPCQVRPKALPAFEDESKENVDVGSDLKPASPNVKQTKNGDGDISMETSLSSWLVEPENSSVSKCTSDISGEKTPCSHDQRAASSESLISVGVRECAKSSSTTPRSQGVVKRIMLGTVGSYWSNTGQATNSDSGSSAKALQCKMNVNKETERESTAFELRLEMAT